MNNTFTPVREEFLHTVHQGPLSRDGAARRAFIMVPKPVISCHECGVLVTAVAVASVFECHGLKRVVFYNGLIVITSCPAQPHSL